MQSCLRCWQKQPSDALGTPASRTSPTQPGRLRRRAPHMQSCLRCWPLQLSDAVGINEQGLVNSAWAFATAGIPHAELFAVLAIAAERRSGDQRAGPRQLSLGVCDGGLPTCRAVCGVGKSSRATHWGLQRAGPRQLSLGVCDGGLPTCRAVCGVGHCS